MRYDFSPLYRSIVGFDNLSRVIESALNQSGDDAYPPFDIEKVAADQYRISMAVAGFAESDLDLTVSDTLLVVRGKAQPEAAAKGAGTFLHRGIARRAFERRFNLADHVRVSGARLENGLLVIELQREVPETHKPRRIEIASAAKAPLAVSQEAA